MVNLVHLLALALLGSVIALAGGVVFLYKKTWSRVLEKYSVPFAAGVLITVSLVGLLPEALELIGTDSLTIVLVTFFAAYLFEQIFFGIHHHCDCQHDRDYKASVPLILVGDTIHNFIDGVAIGASYVVAPGLGLITALSTFLHEVPHEIGDFGILLKVGWPRIKILTANIVSASATVVGAFALLLFSGNEPLIGVLLAVSAGVFLYLGASDFLPMSATGKTGKFKAVLPLTIGIAVMLGTLMAVPHSH